MSVSEITSSPEFREVERLREKARHDEAQALYHAEQKGRQEGRQEGISERNIEIARSMLRKNISTSDISDITGLSYDDVEKLRHAI